MEPPIGFIRLPDAVYVVGNKLFGSDWRPTSDWSKTHIALGRLFNSEVERVITKIAEWCEAGEISAVYRSITGVDDLDRSLWRRPHWQQYFADGTIDLDLPLVDENLRPNPNGYTARCTREIYLRRDDLDRLITILSTPKSVPSPSPKASRAQIRRVIAQYRQRHGGSPSMDAAVQFAQDNGVIGHQKELREEYRIQFGHPRVGRRPK